MLALHVRARAVRDAGQLVRRQPGGAAPGPGRQRVPGRAAVPARRVGQVWWGIFPGSLCLLMRAVIVVFGAPKTEWY